MSIKDVVNEFEGEIEGEVLNVDIHSWKEPGDWIGGELVSMQEFKEGNFENTCQQYIFKTDDGLESCVLGQAVDKQVKDKMKIGQKYYIKFKGKVDLGDGRSVNRFSVVDMTEWLKNKQADLERKRKEEQKPKKKSLSEDVTNFDGKLEHAE